jgi:hypothetical protein
MAERQIRETLTVSTVLLVLTYILAGCATRITESPRPQEVVSEKDTLSYEVVYESEKGDFKVREAFLGSLDTWRWEDFSMPQARIQNTIQDLGLQGRCDTMTEFEASGWCTDSARIEKMDGKEHRYDLACDSVKGSHCLLKKDSRVIWQGDLIAMTCGPVIASRRIGEEIAIDYTTVIPESRGKTINSILLTQGDGTIDLVETTRYDAAFAPNEIQGKLIHFAYDDSANRQALLVFDGEEIAEYDSVFNQFCCWDGPPIQVFCNGEVIDFFAKKDGGWYHVQAGHLAHR